MCYETEPKGSKRRRRSVSFYSSLSLRGRLCSLQLVPLAFATAQIRWFGNLVDDWRKSAAQSAAKFVNLPLGLASRQESKSQGGVTRHQAATPAPPFAIPPSLFTSSPHHLITATMCRGQSLLLLAPFLLSLGVHSVPRNPHQDEDLLPGWYVWYLVSLALYYPPESLARTPPAAPDRTPPAAAAGRARTTSLS